MGRIVNAGTPNAGGDAVSRGRIPDDGRHDIAK
jgi:hypothetical protein